MSFGSKFYRKRNSSFVDHSGIQTLLCTKDKLSQHRSWQYSCNRFLPRTPETSSCSCKIGYVNPFFLTNTEHKSVPKWDAMAPSHQPTLFVFQLSIDDFTYFSESYGNKKPFQNVQASIYLFYFFMCSI